MAAHGFNQLGADAEMLRPQFHRWGIVVLDIFNVLIHRWGVDIEMPHLQFHR